MIRLLWTAETAPHLVLEITRSCNIVCHGCYKRRSAGTKSLDEIEKDLDTALALRRVHTVSIAGAEPTLHPQLVEIVDRVRRRGLRAALITNGLLLDDPLLGGLRRVGLDVVMVHVDEGQQRPDLPAHPTSEEVNALRLAITRRVAARGMDAGLCTTICRDTLPKLPSLIRLVLESEHIGFLFATHFVDVPALVTGSVPQTICRTENAEVARMLRDGFGLEPFADADPMRPLHWMSYFVPVAYNGGPPRVVSLQSGALDAMLVSLPWRLTGRHFYYCRPNRALTAVLVLVNRLAHGDVRTAARFLFENSRGARVGVKRMVFDNGLKLGADGRLQCLEYCPNATVRAGKLVPVCLSDYAESPCLPRA
jgi:hypothetical protein